MTAARGVLAPKKIRRFTGLLCLAGLVVALVLGISPHIDHPAKKAVSRGHFPARNVTEGRKIYPLSVIGGGAYSAEELNRARRLDSVVRAHYANYGKNPVIQQTPADLFMYVSYRKSDAVYWTRTKRRIPKGESVLSDGKNLARARCGNRLSFTPQQPTSSEKELPEEAFNTPEAPKVSIPFDTPSPPATEADLYVPANPLLTGLFSPLPPPSPFGVFHPGASPLAGGTYLPMPGWGAGAPTGGAPFFGGGSGFLARVDAAGPGISSAIPIIGTPEPATAKLLLISILIVALLFVSGRIHSRQ